MHGFLAVIACWGGLQKYRTTRTWERCDSCKIYRDVFPSMCVCIYSYLYLYLGDLCIYLYYSYYSREGGGGVVGGWVGGWGRGCGLVLGGVGGWCVGSGGGGSQARGGGGSDRTPSKTHTNAELSFELSFPPPEKLIRPTKSSSQRQHASGNSSSNLSMPNVKTTLPPCDVLAALTWHVSLRPEGKADEGASRPGPRSAMQSKCKAMHARTQV